MQWMKLYDRKSIYTTMVDKYEAKKYLADRIDSKYIIPTLGCMGFLLMKLILMHYRISLY